MAENLFTEENARKFWNDLRDRVENALTDETIDFSGETFREDPDGNYFHGVAFKNEINFSGATFLYSTMFNEAIFTEDVVFEKCAFPKGGIFMFTEFHGDAEFEGIICEDKMRFAGVTFKQDANFSNSTFKEIAVFESEEYADTLKHKKTTFEYFANFNKCKWQSQVRFTTVDFFDDVCFKDGVFEYEVDIDWCDVKGQADFVNASFLEYSGKKDKRRNRVRLQNNVFRGKVDFWNSCFDCNVRFANNEFQDQAEFRKAVFNKSVFIDRKNSFGDRLYLDKSYKSFSRAEDAIEPYRTAKQTSHRAGDSRMEGNYHFQEQCAVNKTERKSITWQYLKEHPWRGIYQLVLSWGAHWFGNWVYGYGEKTYRILVAAMVVILFCSGLFFAFEGINYGSLPVDNPVPAGPKQLAFEAVDYPLVECRLEDGVSRDWRYAGNCLYFSIVTFTTLGYGDFQPFPHMRWLSAIEAALGAALIAMFIVSLSRKFVR